VIYEILMKEFVTITSKKRPESDDNNYSHSFMIELNFEDN
jgi:hypothetical protein